MRGVKVVGPKQIEVVDWPDEELGSHDVSVAVKSSALCRSDLSIYYQEPLVGRLPAGAVVPGHEPAGVVDAVGDAVDWLRPGDRVAVQCFDGCDHCRYCQAGSPNLCPQVKILGFDRHGGDADTLVTPASTCLRIPDEMSFDIAAVATDAIGNLYNTMKELNVTAKDRVAIIGVGPMGLAGVLCAAAFNAEVIAIDVVEHRLEMARALGARHTFHAADAEEKVRKLTDSFGVDVVVECSGKQPAIRLAFEIVGRFGRIGQIGVGDEAQIGLMSQLVGKKLTYVGSWYFRMWEWDEICDFIINRISNERAEQIISHRYPLETEAVREAWRLFDAYETNKVVFNP
jgi:propanol-preferring alcohol dehydrogenase